MSRKHYTCIAAAIEEADFEAIFRTRQMFVYQIGGDKMVLSPRHTSYKGRAMYRTGIRR